MFERNRMPEHDDPRPAIAGVDEERAIRFLLDHLKNANLQSRGSTQANALDFRVTSNEEFWAKLLHERNMTLRWVELSRFQIVDWFPRTPGLYHTDNAQFARREAEHYVREEDGIRFYDPHGKFHMMQGGTGSVRFKPILIEREEHWLCTATSDGYAHSGVPIAIPNRLIQKVDFSDYRYWFKIVGQVKFLPKFLEEHFHQMSRVPQIYILVDNLDILVKEKSVSPVKITPMVFFTGEIQGYRREPRERWRGEERGSVTYVTCHADSLGELDRAADWLNWYAQRYHGEIVTNFDEQRPTFQDAPFSLQNIMNGKLDKYRMRDFNIEHAEIVCDTVQQIHSEATTMTQIEVKLGNGATIHGDFVVANSIKDSFNKVSSSGAPDELKGLLEKLTTAVGKMTEQLPNETAQQVARDLDTLVAEATSPAPRKQWWQLSIEGLKKAAQDIGEIGKPVLELAGLLVPLLLSKPA